MKVSFGTNENQKLAFFPHSKISGWFEILSQTTGDGDGLHLMVRSILEDRPYVYATRREGF